MSSHSNYKNDYSKNSEKGKSSFSKPKSMVREKDITEQKRERIILWNSFFRKNLHRFVEMYLEIKLFPYQVLWIYLLGISDSFVGICSRAAAKSWVIGLYAVCRCILYPGSLVVVVSSTIGQASTIISEKIQGMVNSSPNLEREIEKITTNTNNYEVIFHNGSSIRVVASKESARGKRAQLIIYDEFRIIPKDVVDAVLRPFASVRMPPFIKNAEYSHLIEEPRDVFISSAHFKSMWWYQETLTAIKRMIDGVDNSIFFATDYLISLYHGIKTPKQIAREKSKMEDGIFLMEYENLAQGESTNSFYKYSMFTKLRHVKKGFYPQRNDNYNPKKNPYGVHRAEGEIRVLSVDIATRSGKANDLTILACIRLLPTSKGYTRELSYLESHTGANTVTQGLRVKQLYHDFESDYIVLDMLNAGISIFDQLGMITKDSERGLEYEAITVMFHPSIEEKVFLELSERTLGLNAKPCIYPISGTSKLNSEIAVSFREKLKQKMFAFLIDEQEAESFLMENNKEVLIADDELGVKAFFKSPYIQTTLLVNECVNLTMSLSGGNIKLEEESGWRKDRYSCVSYGSWFASFFDGDLLRETKEDDSDDWLMSTMTL
jgi:hypothetical protein